MEVRDRSSVSVWGRSSHEIEREFDLKIFYDLCRASREVVIRSKIELNNKRRYVEDVESMQELALAWENYRFGERDRYKRRSIGQHIEVILRWSSIA